MKKNKQEFLKEYIKLCKKYGFYVCGDYSEEEDCISDVDEFFDYQVRGLKKYL